MKCRLTILLALVVFLSLSFGSPSIQEWADSSEKSQASVEQLFGSFEAANLKISGAETAGVCRSCVQVPTCCVGSGLLCSSCPTRVPVTQKETPQPKTGFSVLVYPSSVGEASTGLAPVYASYSISFDAISILLQTQSFLI
jgi:hypothetical protein